MPSHRLGRGLISHVSWASLWLGFHVFGLFVHNDTLAALANPAAQVLVRPVFAEFVQAFAALAEPALNSQAFFRHLAPADFFAHHSIAVGLHTTTLILLKGCGDARGSRLMPDKHAHGFGFACDGPGRGGSCDLSAWDAVYLAAFWVLNTEAWALFYMHWAWTGALMLQAFPESSATLLGWFRDYLWYFSSYVIRGYGAGGVSELSALSWAFLLGHLTWATGLDLRSVLSLDFDLFRADGRHLSAHSAAGKEMLILIQLSHLAGHLSEGIRSWRGYWQELIEIVAYSHLCAPVLASIWKGAFSPAALSIVQARCVGLAHFSVGLISTYFSFLSSLF
jgi:photosystem I P700 chlorophyll a apoprotein A2